MGKEEEEESFGHFKNDLKMHAQRRRWMRAGSPDLFLLWHA